MVDYSNLRTTKQVAEEMNFSQSYIKLLCHNFGVSDVDLYFLREGKTAFFARKIGNSWVIDIEEFKDFWFSDSDRKDVKNG